MVDRFIRCNHKSSYHRHLWTQNVASGRIVTTDRDFQTGGEAAPGGGCLLPTYPFRAPELGTENGRPRIWFSLKSGQLLCVCSWSACWR
jgi:hypothetical protein